MFPNLSRIFGRVKPLVADDVVDLNLRCRVAENVWIKSSELTYMMEIELNIFTISSKSTNKVNFVV